jgi:type IV pilus assembly protein PilC
MSTFAFKALDLSGAPTRGEFEAEDATAVAAQLRGRGLIVLDVRETASAELTVATRQLATMVSSGMTLLRALHVLEEQSESEKLREVLGQVRRGVEGGVSLSAALARHPEIFSDLYVAMVAAGESGGILEDTLRRVADQLEKDDSLRRQVKSAMMYPSVIAAFAGLVALGLVAFLVPVFEKVFKDLGGELPAITRFTVALSDLVTGRWYLIIGGVVAALVAFSRWRKTERGREQWDRLKLRAPFKIGGIVQKVALARFSRTYSSLVAAGVPTLEVIDVTGRTSGNRVVERAMDAVRESVTRGGSIAAPMRSEPRAFPPMVAQMVAVGEETGALEAMLAKIADFYEDEVAATVKALTSILEPVMIVVVGAIVGFVVVAMYMPMFQIYDQIK